MAAREVKCGYVIIIRRRSAWSDPSGTV